jgi:hypothetical protein
MGDLPEGATFHSFHEGFKGIFVVQGGLLEVPELLFGSSCIRLM